MAKITETKGYVLTGPAARFYDAVNLFFGVTLVNRRHLRLIQLKPGEHLLDIGCGTAEIIEMLFREHGDRVFLYGIDASSDILRVAREKLGSRPTIRLETGLAGNLPYPDETFHWVVSCLTTHHLPLAEKRAMLSECYRVLRPGGRLVTSDFGKPRNLLGKVVALPWRIHAYSKENMEDVMIGLVEESGLRDVESNLQAGLIQHLTATKHGP